MKKHRAFTIVELIIGMAITAIVLAALATVSYAVAVNWKQAAAVESSFVTSAQVQARLSQWFRGARSIGAYHQGSLTAGGTDAAVFFWKSDETSVTYPSGDGQIQFNEIGLLEYDRNTEQLRLYEVSDWATWSAASQNSANALAGSTFITNTSNMDDFRQACPAHRVVMGNVTGFVVHPLTTGDRPLIEYVIKVRDSGGSTATHYGTITLRAPTSASN
jgi:prepilin-type N-terminal cleavage/methylation domain-containing protein